MLQRWLRYLLSSLSYAIFYSSSLLNAVESYPAGHDVTGFETLVWTMDKRRRWGTHPSRRAGGHFSTYKSQRCKIIHLIAIGICWKANHTTGNVTALAQFAVIILILSSLLFVFYIKCSGILPCRH